MTGQPTHIDTAWDAPEPAQWLRVKVLGALVSWAHGAVPTCVHRARVTLGPPDVTIIDVDGSVTRCMDCTMDALAVLPGEWVDGRTCDRCGERAALVTTFAAADVSPAILLLVALCERCIPGGTGARPGANA